MNEVPETIVTTDAAGEVTDKVIELEVVETREGAFGVHGSPDVSGFGGLVEQIVLPAPAQRPYGSWFDSAADALEAVLGAETYRQAISKVVVDRDELTFEVNRESLPLVARALRDDPTLRFETCLGVSGVHWLNDTGKELHAVYHFRSMTHGGRYLRVEVTCPDTDPHIPSITSIFPANNWHERETYDMFGIIFDGHPALTRILMPDDWLGHPQRKDYPLGGIPVEHKGSTTPPPDERREYS